MTQELDNAFSALRGAGYFAEQNYLCCQTCGWATISDEQADKVVFYHQQDAENLAENGECFVAWSGDGQEICSIFNDNGINTKWDENDNTRIKIII